MIGQRVGPYAVLQRLGGGGMGEVYLAEDTRLGRHVALKRPSEAWLSAPDARERLHREASAAGRLTHPNIAAIYDVLDVDSHPYIVMEYVEGESLADVLRRGPLPLEQALTVALEVAEALAAAHVKGVIHRDLKPANISLTSDGHAKVLDFGLAKGPGSTRHPSLPGQLATITAAGQVMGTPGYSSPEQLVGAAADPRDDIYSLGIVLFELLTGRRPFEAEDALGLAVATMTRTPPAAHDLNGEVPRALSAVVARAIARAREDRFRSVEEMRTELRGVTHALSTQVTGPVSTGKPSIDRRNWRRMVPVSAALLLAWAVPLALWWNSTRSPNPGQVPVLAVLPFSNHSPRPDDASIAAAMRDVLIANLGGQPGINVLSKAATVESSVDRGDLKKLSKTLGATFLVDGSVQRSGSDLMVSVSVVQGDTGIVVWSRSYEAPEKDVFSLQERISDGVSRAQPIGTAGGGGREPRAGSHDVDALYKFGQAVQFLERPDIPGNLARAIQLLRSALERDANFALAWARLGEAYWATYQDTRDPKWAAEAATATHEALRLNRDQPGVWISLALIHHGTGRHEVAVGELNQALSLQPSNDDAHRLLGQVLQDMGRPEEAADHYRQAIALRPDYWRHYNVLGGLYYATGRSKEAIEAFTRVTELQPDNARGFHNLGAVYYALGDNRNALKYYEDAIVISPMADTYSNIGIIHYDEGRFEAAVESFQQAVKLAPNDGILRGNLGDAHDRLGQKEQARRAWQESLKMDRQFLTVNPKDATTRARLAVREAKLGERQAAEASILSALALNPTDAEVLYHGAVVRALNGDVERALASLEQALRHGYSSALAVKDRDLETLRKLPRFRQLVSSQN